MNRGIFAAASGMKANQLMLDVLSNNLANMNTTGFKADGMAFTDMLEREMVVPGEQFDRPVGRLGAGTTVGAKYTTHTAGQIQSTGRLLDVCLTQPKQFFAIETKDGKPRFTRDGSFSIDSEGTLVTVDGHSVLDSNGSAITVPAGYKELHIDNAGQVIVDNVPVGVIDVKEGDFVKVGQNLWAVNDGGQADSVDKPEIATGALEGSNVNAIEMMVEMISVMRSFESSQKAVQAQDEATGQLLQSLAR